MSRSISEENQKLLSALNSADIKSVFNAELSERPISLDLSDFNQKLQELDVLNTAVLNRYIEDQIQLANGTIGVGGYLEQRGRYADSEIFRQTEKPRCIHLGIDVWTAAGADIYTPLDAKVHSFQDNANYFDYGPTILLEHEVGATTFYTLYGHLSRESLQSLKKGDTFSAGQQIAKLGSSEVNGDWPPHLHFQIICDLQNKEGDYPGVAAKADLDFYRLNCPNPNLILKYSCLES